MGSNTLPSPHLDWSNPDRGAAIQKFKRQCNLWFAANDTSPDKQFNFILLWSGQEGLELSETWELSENDLKDPKNVWEKLEASEPKENFRIHRLEFQKILQAKNDESVDEYVTRLKLKMNKCKIVNKDERIIDQIIAGIKYPEAQRKLLQRDDTLTLSQAIDVCKTQEASTKYMDQMKQLSDKTESCSVDAHQQKSAKGQYQRPQISDCRNCGRTHPPRRCPAYNSTCSFCRKKGHWIDKCLSRSKRNDMIDIHTDGRNTNDDNNIGLTFDCINSQNDDSRTEIFADLNIKVHNKDAKLKVKVDTGAQGNILPLRTFRKMYPHKVDGDGYPRHGAITPNTTTLLAYNGTRINQFGCISVPCQYNNSSISNETFYVADTDGPVIFGLPSSRRHSLVMLNCPINTTNPVTSINDAKDLKAQYPDRFEGIGEFQGEVHIELKEDSPKTHIQPNRKYPIQMVPEINSEIDRMEAIGVIEPIDEPTDWVNALAFSRKASGGLRVCLDPKELNKNIKRTHHKTPTIEEITNKLNGSKFFSKLDARHGYWSVKLDDESSKLTTFNSPKGRYRFKRLPFGLNISQDIFQKHMDSILSQCPGTTGITDDIIVFGQTEDEHDNNLKNLMSVARKSGLVFNEEKCFIKKNEIKFFGMIFDANGIRPDPEKTEAISKMTAPTNHTDLQRFLGIVQFMHQFIPNLSDLTEPLRSLLKKDAIFDWNASHEKCFEDIKTRLCDATSLAYFDVNKHTTIQVDASQKGLGAALIQDNRPIAFASKSLTETEQRYANIERELLAVVFGCERFHTFIFGGKTFTVESDHKPLEQIFTKSLANTPPRLQRMMLRLQPYNMNITYRPGKEMILADALSRLEPNYGPTIPLEQSIYAVQFSDTRLLELKDKTVNDTALSKLKSTIQQGWPENARYVPKCIRNYWSMKDELSIEDEIILKGERVIIPESMKSYILDKIHTGHLGIQKCQLRARESVFWHNMNQDIEDHVKKCIVCRIHSKNSRSEPMIPHPIPNYPWEIVGSDVFQFDSSDYLLVTDYFSKMFFVRKMGISTTTEKVIAALKQMFGEHGIPMTFVSDNATYYTSEAFKNFAKTWGFKPVTSSPTYPQSNGLSERNIQTVKNILIKAKETNTDYELALLIFRSTPVENSLPSPAKILYNRNIRANLPTITKCQDNRHREIRDNLQTRQNRQKKYYDRGTRPLKRLNTGQHIMMQKYNGSVWEPAIVTQETKYPRSYIVQTPNGKTYRRNRRQLMDLHPQTRLDDYWSNDNHVDEENLDRQEHTNRPTETNEGNDLDTTDTPTLTTQLDRPRRLIKRPERLIETM